MMSANDFHLADLMEEEGVLEEIRRLEKKLSEQHGSEVVLIAYSADSSNRN